MATQTQTLIAPETECVLESSEREFRRLIRQGESLDAATREMLMSAGLLEGMRVLDLGCSAGDVSFLAGGLVGLAGQVVGIDRDEAAVRFARRRAEGARITNVEFLQARIEEVEEIFPAGSFDAVIGRFVLAHQPDPVSALRGVLPVLAYRGIAAFLEPEFGRSVEADPEVPLVEQCVEWFQKTLSRAGVQMNMGTQLSATFVKAGLAEPQTRLTIQAGGSVSYFGYQYWGGYHAKRAARGPGARSCEAGTDRHRDSRAAPARGSIEPSRLHDHASRSGSLGLASLTAA